MRYETRCYSVLSVYCWHAFCFGFLHKVDECMIVITTVTVLVICIYTNESNRLFWWWIGSSDFEYWDVTVVMFVWLNWPVYFRMMEKKAQKGTLKRTPVISQGKTIEKGKVIRIFTLLKLALHLYSYRYKIYFGPMVWFKFGCIAMLQSIPVSRKEVCNIANWFYFW